MRLLHSGRYRYRLILSLIVFGIIYALGLSCVYALANDNKKPATLSADQVDFNHKTGKGVYTGHVIIVQGTTEIHADKLITYTDPKNNKLAKAIAYGKPARYQTLPKQQQTMFYARADTITYYPQKKLIFLSGNAHVKQGKNLLTSPHIKYNISQGEVITKGNSHQRTKIVFTPNDIASDNKGKTK